MHLELFAPFKDVLHGVCVVTRMLHLLKRCSPALLRSKTQSREEKVESVGSCKCSITWLRKSCDKGQLYSLQSLQHLEVAQIPLEILEGHVASSTGHIQLSPLSEGSCLSRDPHVLHPGKARPPRHVQSSGSTAHRRRPSRRPTLRVRNPNVLRWCFRCLGA